MPSRCTSHWLGILLVLSFHATTTRVHSFHNSFLPAPPRRLQASSASGDAEDGNQKDSEPTDGEASISPAAVTVDDGGSDLNDRFKYKVHALMGTYDPPPGAIDDENQNGNILGAMLHFPTEYTFTAVGKNEIITGERESVGDNYADQVKRILGSVLGSDAKMEVRVVPRGQKFTRVSAKVEVESAKVISSIHDKLDALEATVMKF